MRTCIKDTEGHYRNTTSYHLVLEIIKLTEQSKIEYHIQRRLVRVTTVCVGRGVLCHLGKIFGERLSRPCGQDPRGYRNTGVAENPWKQTSC